MGHWDTYENDDGTITLCYLVPDKKWGNWGEVVLTKEQLKRWRKGDEELENYVYDNLA